MRKSVQESMEETARDNARYSSQGTREKREVDGVVWGLYFLYWCTFVYFGRNKICVKSRQLYQELIR